MTLASPPSLYNQSFLSDKEFVANFVARRQVLDTLCRRLKGNGSANDGQHQILIGTRGMGKTSLLRRLAIEIDRDQELSAQFIPLMFREEQYNVLHLRDFWKNCGEALAEWAERHGKDELAARLDAAICSEAWVDDEGTADQFLHETSALGKRAVLMVDNLDLILDALKDTDHWNLRSSLQLRGGPILIGAATQALRESANRDAAFYEFFQPSYLEPLDLPETECCMRALANGRGELGQRVLGILQRDPARLRVLHRLTGGNPRVLALTYRFLETTDTRDAMGDLERLLDEVTPYYKARIEEHQTPLQRATIDAIALHWDPVTTGQLAKITGVPSTTLSPQLIRLRKDGLIESTETSGSYAGHQITERFLNIWYLMRHGTRRTKQRMRWLVAFLSTFYSSNDLATIYQEAKKSGLASSWTKDYADAFEQARKRAAPDRHELLHPVIQGIEKTEQGDNEFSTAVGEAETMFNEAIAIDHSGDTAAAIETYDALIVRFGNYTEPAFLESVARAMFNRGFAVGQSGDAAATIEAYDALIARFGDNTDPALLEPVAKAMFNKAIALDQSGDAAAAIETYDALIARFGDNTEPALLEPVVQAMFNMGSALGQSGDAAAAIEAYDALIARFGENTEPALLEPVVQALGNKGVALDRSGDATAAIETYEQALALLHRLDTESAKRDGAEVAVRLGNTLFDNGIDQKRSEALFLQAIEHNPLSAYSNLFWLYVSSGRIDEAKHAIGKIDKLPPKGRALINAALAFDVENFGQATEHLQAVLSGDHAAGGTDFTDDLERLIRLAIARGFGERLVAWFEKTRFSERYAPIHVALLAAVRGERMLLDSNPEVRHAANEIYLRLIGGKR